MAGGAGLGYEVAFPLDQQPRVERWASSSIPFLFTPSGVLRSLAVLNKRLSALLTVILVLLVLPALMAPDDSGLGGLAGVGIAGIICVALGALIGFAIEIYIIYFLYTDANARGQNGVLWAIIGFFTGLLGLIIWLIMRPEKKV